MSKKIIKFIDDCLNNNQITELSLFFYDKEKVQGKNEQDDLEEIDNILRQVARFTKSYDDLAFYVLHCGTTLEKKLIKALIKYKPIDVEDLIKSKQSKMLKNPLIKDLINFPYTINGSNEKGYLRAISDPKKEKKDHK